MNKAEEILAFWFGDLDAVDKGPGRFELWFGKSEKTDGVIRESFAEDLERAGRGEYDGWRADPRTCLALVVLLDQFPRDIFRGERGAFAFDAKTREIVENGLTRGFDGRLPLFGRLFFYLPLEHSENLADQERSVALYEKLLADAPPEKKETFKKVLDYARRHREIIARFGRFPHRNRQLGRSSTAEEEEFLKQPNSSF